MNRRDFIAGSLGFGTATCLADVGTRATGTGQIRFLAFADIHYESTGRWPHPDREWLDRILRRAVDAKADFVISLGDMTFGPVTDAERDYVRHYNSFGPIPTYHVYGNHEYERVTPEELDALYGLARGYYSFDKKGFRFIVLDPHYVLKDGVCRRFFKRCSYKEEKRDRMLPPDQIDWLRKTVLESPYPCVVFSHESIERIRGGISNRKEVLEIFAEANAKRPGTVRLVVNGHEHKDNLRILDNVAYLDLNSATYDIEKSHTAYPEAFRKKCHAAGYTLTWNDPLSAVVTLSQDGNLRIDGTESSFYLGVTPEMAGWRGDSCGRITTPRIQSADMRFRYVIGQ